MILRLRCISILFILLCQFKGIGQGPGCTQLSSPADGAVDVPVNSKFEWNAAERATEYVLIAGTTFGGNDILNNVSVGVATEYMLDENLPAGQIIYVAIITLNSAGANGSCEQVQFTTRPSDGLPPCTIPISPENLAQNISTNPNLVWQPVENADGYLLTLGTTSGAQPILERFDVGNLTSFMSPALVENSTYYFSVIPYNENGMAENCEVQNSFTTEETPLTCTEILSPERGTEISGTGVRLSWQSIVGADGYLLSVGTNSNSGEFLNRMDVGNVTTFEIPQELPSGIEVLVLIVPYKNSSEALDCNQHSFRTAPIDRQSSNILVPAFFTPNNDGINDSWSLSDTTGFDVQSISVFDRYGKLLVQLSPSQEWDGTINGRNLPSGSYWYTVNIANPFSVIRGYFLLKR